MRVEATAAPAATRLHWPRYGWPTLVVSAVALAGLAYPSAGTHPDEGLYIALALEMFERGQWLTATLDGVPNFVKPPLLYWAMEGSFAVFGCSLWVARLFSAGCGVALACLAGVWTARFHGEEAAKRAILFVGTCVGVLRFGHLAMMDVPLALALAVAVECTWRAVERKAPRWLLLAAVATGLGVLLKGPIALVLAGCACAGTLWLLKSELTVSRWTLGAGALSALVAAPWFIASSWMHGAAFTDRFFGVENAGKFSGPWELTRAFGMYGALFVLCVPWVIFLFGAKPGRQMIYAALIWVAAVLVPYTLPSIMFPHYVVPALVPVLCLAAASPPSLWPARILGAVAGVIALAFGAASLTGWVPLRLGVWVLALVFAASAWSLWTKHIQAAIVLYALACVVGLHFVLPKANPAPDEAVWSAVANVRVVTWGQHPGVWSALSGRTVGRVYEAAELHQVLRECHVALLTDAERSAVEASFGHSLAVRSSFERFRGRLEPAQLWAGLLASDARGLRERLFLVTEAGCREP
jgi:4-amino-4-deoxy-L-arabinose transferase-like glycosyltransferase